MKRSRWGSFPREKRRRGQTSRA